MRYLVLVLLSALGLASAAGPATAAVVKVADGAVTYQGDVANETVEISRAQDPEVDPSQAYQLVVPDGTTAEAPCTKPADSIYAYCPASVGQLPVRLAGAGGDDTLSTQVNPGAINVPVTLDGGEGNDRLNGAFEVTTLLGGPGDDVMSGDSNRSRGVNANGRAGDTFSGGDGVDQVSYFNHGASSVTVTIDGVPDDGTPGEGDNVMTDVENIEGMIGGSNFLTGSAGPNELLGSNAGDDTLRGGGGNDRLLGFDRADRLEGGDGDDYLEGGFGDDSLDGGAGLDSFIGDRTERNVVGVGNDTILARDGIAEPVSCGPGSDRAVIDAADTVAIDGDNQCETIERDAAPGGGGGAGGGGSTAAAFLFIKTTPVRVGRTRRVRISVTCLLKDAAGCNGVLRLRSGRRTLGSRSFSIAPSRSARISVTLSRSTVRRLKRSQKITVSATSRPPGRTATARITLRR